jgi:long-subunit fatty acid transport protein
MISILIIFFRGEFSTIAVFAQEEDRQLEKIESKIEELNRTVIEEKKKKTPAKLSSSIKLSAGYETNAKLSRIRKGDLYEELGYSINYFHSLTKNTRFVANYNLDVQEYNEITDISHMLNHMKLGFETVLNKALLLGTAYDFTYLHYHDSDESNNLTHKGSVYLKHKFSKKSYQQITVESSIKDYPTARALADFASTYQYDDRRDDRIGIEYSVASTLNKKTNVRFRFKISDNNSNAKYQDFYDYKTYDFNPRFTYKLSDKIGVSSGFTYSRKNYESRNVSSGTEKTHDNVYTATAGLTYKLTKNDSLNLNYVYRQAISKDSLSNYSGSTISSGWQHSF